MSLNFSHIVSEFKSSAVVHRRKTTSNLVDVDLTSRAQRRQSKLHFYWEHFRRTDCCCCYEIMLLCSFMNVGATFKNTACIRALCASVCISRKLNLRLGEQDWELKQAPADLDLCHESDRASNVLSLSWGAVLAGCFNHTELNVEKHSFFSAAHYKRTGH